jgi:uncharacterized membrane protein YphA (DoxX/SURF4 family)/thiol-disulfide isomerase/thioredoxin
MVLLIALLRIALSAVFGAAGVTKLLDLNGTREAVTNFGAPKTLVPALAIILPLLELSIAIGLLFNQTVWWSALAALLLLGLFILAISINLAQGRTHDCHCFGQLHSRPIGWTTIARNVLFAVAAAVVLWPGRQESNPEIVTTLGDTLARLNEVGWVVLIAVVIGAAGALIYSQRRAKRAAAKAEAEPKGLPLGSIAPPFDLPAYEGGRKSLAQLIQYGKPLLLVFANPKCGPCITLFKEISEWQQAHDHHLTIAIVTIGTIKDNFVNVARNGLGEVLLQEKGEVAQQYEAMYTPSAVVVTPDGRIGSPMTAGAESIHELVASTLEPHSLNNRKGNAEIRVAGPAGQSFFGNSESS